MNDKKVNKKKLWILLIFALCLSVVATFAQDARTFDEGVIINGVKWATRNVDKPGTFAAEPENPGMFYQWNRSVGWSTIEPMVNSNDDTDWDSTIPEGDSWEKANDPSPSGWRIPTLPEIQSLLDRDKVDKVWTTQNGVKGMKFTDKTTGNSLFLPAVGLVRRRGDGTLYRAGDEYGGYWSSTKGIGGMEAHGMYFHSNSTGWFHTIRTHGYSVRTVAE